MLCPVCFVIHWRRRNYVELKIDTDAGVVVGLDDARYFVENIVAVAHACYVKFRGERFDRDGQCSGEAETV